MKLPFTRKITMKKSFKYLGIALLLLMLIIVGRTFTFKSKQMVEQQANLLILDDSCVVHLQKAIRFKTISYDDASLMDSTAFIGFQRFLFQTYPLIFSKLAIERVNQFGLILHWKGKSAQANPIILMAHQDVVPAEEATLNKWSEAPFSGTIKNGMVYGRGAIDDKGSLIAIFESTELLLKQGFTPKTDIYFVLGHDEEVSGLKGAKQMAQLFKNRKIKPAFVLDEGGIITERKVPGLKKTAAVIGIAEKGYQTLLLKINIPGGHSSMPEQETAIDEMTMAVVKLKQNPFPVKFSATVLHFLDYVGPEMPFISRMAMANKDLFSFIIASNYSKTAAGNATIRTSTATTIFKAGLKENLIPGAAEITVNFRTLPGTTQNDVITHVKKVIGNNRIQIIPKGKGNEPKQVANIEDASFIYLQKTISAFKKGIVVAPYLALGASDARYFGALTPQVFRFTPFTDPEGFHGVNERIPVKDFKKGISFYYNLMKNY